MARYKLSFRPKEKRWRKFRKGKVHNFPLLDGETKASSYQRVLREWLTLKAQLEAEERGEAIINVRQSWRHVIRGVREAQQGVIDTYGDTEGTREIWQKLERIVVQVINPAIDKGETPDHREHRGIEDYITMRTEDLVNASEDLPVRFAKLKPTLATGPPPWELPPVIGDSPPQLAKAFIASVERQASARRAQNVKRDVDAFLATKPNVTKPSKLFSGQSLDAYLHAVRSLDLASSTKRDKIASVKQFAMWAYEQDFLSDVPKLIRLNKFKIEVSASNIDIYTDDQVKDIVDASKGRAKLYILLALNCGFTQVDIADLTHGEVDLQRGVVTRKRSKTDAHEGVPEVSRKLWKSTLDLLRNEASEDGPRVLINAIGLPLVDVKQVNGKVVRTDAIAKTMQRLRKSMKRKDPISFKKFRATAASKLGEHKEFRAYAQYFLGHSPGTVADKHYVRPSQTQFDRAMRWLGKQFVE